MGIPNCLTCLLRNLYAGQEATVRTRHGTGSKSGKESIKAVYCHPAYLIYVQRTSWEMLSWRKHKLESRLPGEISITSDRQMTPPLWQEVIKNWSFLMKVKEKSGKAGLKVNIWKMKSMESSLITSWQIDGETMETVTNFIFLDSKITADGECSHKIKRHLILGRKAITNLDSILKSKDITLATKIHTIKAMVLPVVMYGC